MLTKFEMKPCGKCSHTCVEGSNEICPFDKPFLNTNRLEFTEKEFADWKKEQDGEVVDKK